MKITKRLHDVLRPRVKAGAAWDELIQDLLFEVPDEAMEMMEEMGNLKDVKVSPETTKLVGQIAEAFGFTPLGLAVLLAEVQPKADRVRDRYHAYEQANAKKAPP